MKWGAALVLGLLAAAVVGGCGSTRIVTHTVATTDTFTATTTTTDTQIETIARTTVTQPARTVTQTVTHTQTNVITTLPHPTRSFSGNGGETIGTLHVSQNSTIKWTNDGALFAVNIVNGTNDYSINSQGSSGTSVLPAGTYPNVGVNAIGNWTIQIVPGG
jgi:ABC-type Fe3+-hydroxamate transport system substrate-binding protein